MALVGTVTAVIAARWRVVKYSVVTLLCTG